MPLPILQYPGTTVYEFCCQQGTEIHKNSGNRKLKAESLPTEKMEDIDENSHEQGGRLRLNRFGKADQVEGVSKRYRSSRIVGLGEGITYLQRDQSQKQAPSSNIRKCLAGIRRHGEDEDSIDSLPSIGGPQFNPRADRSARKLEMRKKYLFPSMFTQTTKPTGLDNADELSDNMINESTAKNINLGEGLSLLKQDSKTPSMQRRSVLKGSSASTRRHDERNDSEELSQSSKRHHVEWKMDETESTNNNVKVGPATGFEDVKLDVDPRQSFVEEVEAVAVDESTNGTFWKRNGLRFMLVAVILATGISLYAVLNRSKTSELSPASEFPCIAPSMAPTVDPLPTLDRIVNRGEVRCAVGDFYFETQLCHAIAAAVLGNSSSVNMTKVQSDAQYNYLTNKSVDVATIVSPYAMDNDVFQDQALGGFTFSTPWFYDGIGFGGMPPFVKCADRLDVFFDECSGVRICVGTNEHYEVVSKWLPSSIIRIVPPESVYSNLNEGKCNVIAGSKFDVSHQFVEKIGNYHGVYEAGNTTLSRTPFSMVTREDDTQWSDFVNWILRALFAAEVRNISKDNASNFYKTHLFGEQFENMFINAIEAIGNYGNLWEDGPQANIFPRPALAGLNDANTGLLYSLPWGKKVMPAGSEPVPGSTMYSILQRGFLRCGITGTSDPPIWSGLGVDYCLALASSLFGGNSSRVELINLTSIEDGYVSLDSKEVDILSGGRVTLEADVQEPTTGQGFAFSLPYFYDSFSDNQGATHISGDSIALVTREEDPQWSDFVFWMVSATFYAEEKGITKRLSEDMPPIKLFGAALHGIYRHAIGSVGNYGEMYERNVGNLFFPRGGRNVLNLNPYGPQIYPSFLIK